MVTQRKAHMGILVTASPAHANMKSLAKDFGTISSGAKKDQTAYPKIQLVSVADFFDPTWKLKLPGFNVTPKSVPPGAEPQLGLPYKSPDLKKARVPSIPPLVAPGILKVAERVAARGRRKGSG